MRRITSAPRLRAAMANACVVPCGSTAPSCGSKSPPSRPCGVDDRALGDDLVRRRQSRFDAERLVDRELRLQPFPALGRGRHAVAAGHVHADALAALGLDLPVQLDRVRLQRGDVRVVVDGVEAGGGVPGGAGRELRALDQRDVASSPCVRGDTARSRRRCRRRSRRRDSDSSSARYSSSRLSDSTARRSRMNCLQGSRPWRDRAPGLRSRRACASRRTFARCSAFRLPSLDHCSYDE